MDLVSCTVEVRCGAMTLIRFIRNVCNTLLLSIHFFFGVLPAVKKDVTCGALN